MKRISIREIAENTDGRILSGTPDAYVSGVSTDTRDMKDGVRRLADGSSAIESGLRQLGGSAGQLTGASAQIRDGLDQIAAALNDGHLDEIDLGGISRLPDGLEQLAAALRELSGGLTQLGDGFAPAYAALDAAVGSIPEPGVTEEEIMSLYMAVGGESGALDQLVANYTAAQTVRGTYAQVKAAFDAVGDTVGAVTEGIGTMASTLDGTAREIRNALSGLDGLDQLESLVSGLNELSENYASFHSGLDGYMEGVNVLASNYGAFHSGLAAFRDGVGELNDGVRELNDGVGELYDGTATLHDETADLPVVIQEEIDKLKDEYMPSDFDPVSFASSKNTDTQFVQFVIQCDGIALPEQEETAGPAPPRETFWDRLAALFTRDGS
jgi:X-X-X-Leu-X-X-Gly heptad repeat protein